MEGKGGGGKAKVGEKVSGGKSRKSGNAKKAV